MKRFLPLLLIAAAPPANVTLQNGAPRAVTPSALIDGSGSQLGTSDNPLYVSGGAGGGGSTANQRVNAQSGDFLTGSIVDIGTATSPAAGTVNARLESIRALLAAPQAVTQSGTWSLGASSAVIGNVRVDQTTPGTTNGVSINPSAATAASITSATVAGATSNVLKNTAGNVYSLNLVNSTVAGFLVLYDATAAPASGTTLTTGLIRYCFPVAASAGFDKVFNLPMQMASGAVELFSTSCTVYTPVGTAPVILTGQVK